MTAPAKTPEVVPHPLDALRAPFPPHQISKLPKESKKQAEERKAGQNAINNCPVCGGWHHKNAVHLDYVGHAALTDRLLDVDPLWSWEPVAFGQDGLPALDRNGGMWIKLTVCGVARLGYGNAEGKSGGDAVKEIIGDALRNAAMRFGAALDLWHKGDLHVSEEGDDEKGDKPNLAVTAAMTAITVCETVAELKAWHMKNADHLDSFSDADRAEIVRHFNARKAAVTPPIGQARGESAATFRGGREGSVPRNGRDDTAGAFEGVDRVPEFN